MIESLFGQFHELLDVLTATRQQDVASRAEGSPLRQVEEPDLLLKFASRIVGGVKVPPGGFPSVCCVGGKGATADFFCSGTLVAPKVVLTAAHCAGNIGKVFFGNDIGLGGTGETVGVSSVAVNPNYGTAKFGYDLALAFLDKAPGGIAPTPIAKTEPLEAATQATLVGFGYNDPSRPTGFGIKRYVFVPITHINKPGKPVPPAVQKKLGFDAAQEFVAGRKHLGKDSCNGDSGGPAFLGQVGPFGETVLGGVTSRATLDATVNCGDGGIYERGDAQQNWIVQACQNAGVQPPRFVP